MSQSTLGDVFNNLDDLSWKDWVYIEKQSQKLVSTSCLVLNPDEAELGSDEFTPIAVEEADMEEFLSVQDLRSVADNLRAWNTQPTLDELCSAAAYYFAHDSFLPEKPDS